MKKILGTVCSPHWGSVLSVVIGLCILVFRDAPRSGAGQSFDYVGALSYFMLFLGVLFLLLYARQSDGGRTDETPVASRQGVPAGDSCQPAEADVARLRSDLAARVKEAADFKSAIERKNSELEALRAKLNRKDLVAVNEAIAALYQSVEFLCERASSGKESSDKVLPQIAEAADELLVAAQLERGMPKPGDRLADLPPNSCTIFNRIPAPTPGQKGLLVEARNSWVGFRSDAQLVIVNPSRVSVYV